MVRTIQSEMLKQRREKEKEEEEKKAKLEKQRIKNYNLIRFMHLNINPNLKSLLMEIAFNYEINYQETGYKKLKVLFDESILSFDYLIQELTNAYDITIPQNVEEYNALKLFFERNLLVIFNYFLAFLSSQDIKKIFTLFDYSQKEYARELILKNINEIDENEKEEILKIINEEKFDSVHLINDLNNNNLDDIKNNKESFKNLFIDNKSKVRKI